MSRSATLFMLATSAALIATQAAAADPTCVGAGCATAPTEAQLRSQSPSSRRGHFRHVHNGYVGGAPVAFAPVAVANPAYLYGGYGAYGYAAYVGRPVYLFAPNAKIITLDRD